VRELNYAQKINSAKTKFDTKHLCPEERGRQTEGAKWGGVRTFPLTDQAGSKCNRHVDQLLWEHCSLPPQPRYAPRRKHRHQNKLLPDPDGSSRIERARERDGNERKRDSSDCWTSNSLLDLISRPAPRRARVRPVALSVTCWTGRGELRITVCNTKR